MSLDPTVKYFLSLMPNFLSFVRNIPEHAVTVVFLRSGDKVRVVIPVPQYRPRNCVLAFRNRA